MKEYIQRLKSIMPTIQIVPKYIMIDMGCQSDNIQ